MLTDRKLGTYGVKSPMANGRVSASMSASSTATITRSTRPTPSLRAACCRDPRCAGAVDPNESVREEFLEIRAPLVQDHTGAKDLLFDTVTRRSDYSITGCDQYLQVRGAIRAHRGLPSPRILMTGRFGRPSIVELFNAPNVNTVAAFPDPCAPPITFHSLNVCNHRRDGCTVQQAFHSAGVPPASCRRKREATGP